MPLQLSHFDASPFLKSLISVLFLHSSGTFSDFQMQEKSAVHTVMQAPNEVLIISADIRSLPGALPFFNLRAACVNSSVDGSAVLI